MGIDQEHAARSVDQSAVVRSILLGHSEAQARTSVQHLAVFNGRNVNAQALEQLAAQVRAHPQFRWSNTLFSRNAVDAFQSQFVLRRLMHDQARYALLCLLFYCGSNPLHAIQASQLGATTHRLATLMRQGKFCGESQVKALLALMRLTGAIAVVRHPADARQRLLTPTSVLTEPVRTWLIGCLPALDALGLLPGALQKVAAYPRLAEGVLSATGAAFVEGGFTIARGEPVMDALFRRDFGYVALMQLVSTRQLFGEREESATMPISDLSDRLKVSRRHLSNLVREWREHGWIERSQRRSQTVQLTSQFMGLADRWLALEIAWMAVLIDWAIRVPYRGSVLA